MATLVRIERIDALEGMAFDLVKARIEWSDGDQSVGWGRDRSLELAAAKALSEAIERRAYMRLPLARRAAAVELDACIDPATLIRYDDRGRGAAGFARSRFDPADSRKLWVRAEPIGTGSPTWVLADFVCNPRAFEPADRACLVTHASTSGCASAFELDDAFLHAALELVERDALMRQWFAQQSGLKVTASTLPAALRARLHALERAGCAAGMQCLDLGAYPAWLAWAQHGGLGFTCVGSASGLDAAAALESALAELETTAWARIAGAPTPAIAPADVRTPADHAALYATGACFRQADALWFGGAERAAFDALCERFAATPELLYRRLERAGHRLYRVDISVPGARNIDGTRPIRSARALGTELIPICFGFGHLPLGMDRWRAASPTAIHPFS